MKRIVLVLCALLLACAAGACALLYSGTRVMRRGAIEPRAERDFVRAELTYDAGTRTLRGTQTIQMTNRTDQTLEEIVLRLFMNGRSGCSVTVSGVTVDGQATAYALDEGDHTVLRIAHGMQAQQSLEIGFTLMIRHGRTQGAALIALPVPAVYEGGAWHTQALDELAEPGYAQALDYGITLRAKEDTAVAFGGQLIEAVREKESGVRVYAAQMQGARDTGFALLEGGRALSREVNGVTITALAGDRKTANALLGGAQEALDALGEIGLAYPYDSLAVVQGGEGADGDVLSGLAALDAGGSKEALLARLTRLIARQTFGIWIENDPQNAPWLSISLASCAEMLAYRARKGEEAYLTRLYEEMEIASYVTRPHGVTVGATAAHFGSLDELTQVLRDQGGAMLLGIGQAAGEEAFIRALGLYVQRCGGAFGTQEAFEQALLEATGSAWDGYLADGLFS